MSLLVFNQVNHNAYSKRRTDLQICYFLSLDTIPFERETILSAQNNADSYWCCKNSEQICIENEQENVAHIFQTLSVKIRGISSLKH